MATQPNLKGRAADYMQAAYDNVDGSARSPARAQAYATMALVLELCRIADALESINEKLDSVIVGTRQWQYLRIKDTRP